MAKVETVEMIGDGGARVVNADEQKMWERRGYYVKGTTPPVKEETPSAEGNAEGSHGEVSTPDEKPQDNPQESAPSETVTVNSEDLAEGAAADKDAENAAADQADEEKFLADEQAKLDAEAQASAEGNAAL